MRRGEGGEEVGERRELNDRVDALLRAHVFVGSSGDVIVDDGGMKEKEETHEKGERAVGCWEPV